MATLERDKKVSADMTKLDQFTLGIAQAIVNDVQTPEECAKKATAYAIALLKHLYGEKA